jgi:hypothetical protein
MEDNINSNTKTRIDNLDVRIALKIISYKQNKTFNTGEIVRDILKITSDRNTKGGPQHNIQKYCENIKSYEGGPKIFRQIQKGEWEVLCSYDDLEFFGNANNLWDKDIGPNIDKLFKKSCSPKRNMENNINNSDIKRNKLNVNGRDTDDINLFNVDNDLLRDADDLIIEDLVNVTNDELVNLSEYNSNISYELKIETKKRSQREKEIQKELKERLFNDIPCDSEVIVIFPCGNRGGRIDILTNYVIIEVKNAKIYTNAIGQILRYSKSIRKDKPKHKLHKSKLVIYLFDCYHENDICLETYQGKFLYNNLDIEFYCQRNIGNLVMFIKDIEYKNRAAIIIQNNMRHFIAVRKLRISYVKRQFSDKLDLFKRYENNENNEKALLLFNFYMNNKWDKAFKIIIQN